MINRSDLIDDFYSIGRTAALLHVSPKTPYRWCRTGDVLRLLERDGLLKEESVKKDIIYARVSSSG